jgi:transportin-1
MLSKAKASADYVNYLTYIFCDLSSASTISPDQLLIVRSSAAISLKNTLRLQYRTLPAGQQIYIRTAVLNPLEDPNKQIRNYAGSVISEIVRTAGVMAWPEAFQELLTRAGNEKGDVPQIVQEAAMSALAKICEDNNRALDRDYQGTRPLEVILPRLYAITASPSATVRALALSTINVFIPQKPTVLFNSIDDLMGRLFSLALDPNDDVRRFVCRSFVQLVDVRPDKIQPHMEGLVTYMVAQQRNTDQPDVALDAAEFWLSVGEHKKLCSSLGPYLNVIIPTLLESMVYDEDDVARLEGEKEDADEEDREEDIKPQFAKGKASKAIGNGTTNTAAANSHDDLEEGELSDGELADDDEGGPDPEEEWNLRKCSAAALDVLASFFHQPVFEVTLPYLKANLTHKEWPNREAAVLAIGAVADGCMDVVVPHLPDLIPFLITLLHDTEPVVRKITCWALARYASWAAHLPNPQLKAQFFEPMMDGILKKMLDGNKSVQEAAASAFSNLEDAAKRELTPYCKPIIQQFVRCFGIYKDRNMFILYDCVQTLAEHVGPALADPQLMELIMPALIERWTKLSDQSRELFPLLECLSYVATALGDAFSDFAYPIFTRCIKIVHQNLEAYFQAANNSALDKPDKDFLITSLDLLSSIVQALPEAKSGELVANSQPKMFDLLRYCMEDPNNDVRQSSYALLGDCAISIFSHLKPVLPTILPILIKQLDINNMPDEEADAAFSVVNNACWSCGEIAIKDNEGLQPYVEKIYTRLLAIIANPEIQSSVNENAAIALGRLGVWYADKLGPHLAEFARRFLDIVQHIDNNDEKGQAFLGFNRTIIQNPQAMEACLLDYFGIAANYPAEAMRQEHLPETFEQVTTF